MIQMFLVLALGIGFGVGGTAALHHEEDGEWVKVITAHDIKEKLDGKDAKLTAVEVTIGPGQSELRHRHPVSAESRKLPAVTRRLAHFIPSQMTRHSNCCCSSC